MVWLTVRRKWNAVDGSTERYRGRTLTKKRITGWDSERIQVGNESPSEGVLYWLTLWIKVKKYTLTHSTGKLKAKSWTKICHRAFSLKGRVCQGFEGRERPLALLMVLAINNNSYTLLNKDSCQTGKVGAKY